MATIKMNPPLTIGLDTPHSATSWQISRDVDFTDVIDESIEDLVNLTEWKSMLPKGDGGYYDGNDVQLYYRHKLHYGQEESDWYDGMPLWPENQDITITNADGSVTNTTAFDINLT